MGLPEEAVRSQSAGCWDEVDLDQQLVESLPVANAHVS